MLSTGILDNKINKNRTKTILMYLLAFVIPLLIVVLVYIGLLITPFGEKTLVISDAKALYMSDLSYISRVLHGQENLLYSFEQGIGINLMGTHSGLLNPANIIVLFFDITNFPTMYSWLMAINISFCGLTMFCFLSSAYQRKSLNLVFSTVYALIGFNVAYCFHYNFLLSVELLPLIALGIRKIIRGKTPWLYLITMMYSILASFYFGFMLCIASAVLFLMWYIEDRPIITNELKKRIWTNYIGTSITAGLLPAVIWLPTYLSFSGGRLEQNSILDFSFAENMSISEFLAKFFIGTNNTSELVDGFPNVFCGILVLFLVVAFFIDKRNPTRKKVIRGIPLLFYFITFYIKAFSMIMQGFSSTNWFNYRYSFVFSFLMIIIAFEEFLQIRDIPIKDIKKALLVFIIIVAIIFAHRFSFVNGGEMLLGLLILALALGAIWWNRKNEKKAPHRVLVMLLVLLVGIESYANFMISANNILEWGFKNNEYQEELFYGSVASEAVTKADSDFYRMVNEHHTNEQCNNDPRLFGYNGLNYFGSCERTFVFQGMSKLGMSWWANRMWYSEGEPGVFDSLFGVKYVIARRDLTEEKGYERIVNISEDGIYRNHNALPIGLISSSEITDVSLDRNPFLNHNNLWKALTGLDKNVFDQENNIVFTYHANIDGEMITYQDAQQYSTSVYQEIMDKSDQSASDEESKASSSDGSETDILNSINNKENYIECSFTARQDGAIYSYIGAVVDDNYGASTNVMRYIGNFKAGDEVTDQIAVNDEMTYDALRGICAEYYVAYANDGTLKEYCEKLQNEAGTLEKLTDNHMIGTVKNGKDERLFFTIPYDEGWTLKIDSVDTPIEKTADLFMSASIPSGSHKYELTFFPKGMKQGMLISVGAIVLLLVMVAYNVITKRKQLSIGEISDRKKENGCIEIETQMLDSKELIEQVQDESGINKGKEDS